MKIQICNNNRYSNMRDTIIDTVQIDTVIKYPQTSKCLFFVYQYLKKY